MIGAFILIVLLADRTMMISKCSVGRSGVLCDSLFIFILDSVEFRFVRSIVLVAPKARLKISDSFRKIKTFRYVKSVFCFRAITRFYRHF